MIKPIILLLVIAFAATSCQDKDSVTGDTSQSASVTIGKFVPPAGSPLWATMLTDIYRIDEGQESLAETLALEADSFRETDGVARLDIILAYGLYRLSLSYRDQNGEELYRNCRPNETQRIDGPAVVLDILLCNGSGAPIGNINEALSISIETKVQASEAQISAAFDTALAAYQKHCQICHGDERSDKNITLIEAVKFSSREPYTLRTLSVDAIEDGRMPLNPIPSWTDDQDSVLQALRCLEALTQDLCETME